MTAQAPTSGRYYVRVSVTWTFHSLTRFPGVPSDVTFTRSSTMEVAPAMPKF